VASESTRSIRVGPRNAGVDCVEPAKATCSTRRQLHVYCAKKVKACHLVQAETVASASLQLWSRLRDDLVLDITRLRNRPHALLLLCDPEYKHVIRSLRSRIGIQAARTYTAPGASQLDRVREQAVRQVAEQIALFMVQERAR
jgi:hypothetical protein